MTILHISKYYAPYLGGIESVAQQVVSALPQHQNIVVCFSNDTHTHYDTINDIPVIRVGVCASIASQDIAPTYYHHLKKLLNTYHPDAVHLHCPNPFLYPIVLRLLPPTTRLIVHWHSDILGKGILYRLIAPLEKRLLDRANLILATSPNYAASSTILQPYTSKTDVLPNVIAEDRFTPQPTDAERIRQIKEQWHNRTLVLFCGRHVPYKGIDRLIEAAQQMNPDIQVLIAGKGPLTSQYQQQASGASNIAFLGALTGDDLRCYYYAADIFAFPSINKAEAFGVALAEAMYCYCVPVTFSLVGSGVNWVNIAGETGLEVSLNDTHAFAQAVNELANKSDLRQQLSQSAHRRVCDLFSAQALATQINHLYAKIED